MGYVIEFVIIFLFILGSSVLQAVMHIRFGAIPSVIVYLVGFGLGDYARRKYEDSHR